MKQPILSIIVPVYNEEPHLPSFFSMLRRQTISRESYEVILSDGGSTDNTKEVAKKFGAIVVENSDKLAEPGVFHGVKLAKGSLVMVLATDNEFIDPQAIEKIVQVFDDASIYAAFPKHDSLKTDTIWTKYYNTFSDPFTHVVYGFSANARTFARAYKTIHSSSIYDIYDYTSNPVRPIIALAQGMTIRSVCLQKRVEKDDDIVLLHQLISEGKHIAYVHSVPILHHTVKNFSDMLKKFRRPVVNAFASKNIGLRKRTSSLTHWQKVKILFYVPYSLSMKMPMLVAIGMAIYMKEMLWLMHPVVTYISAIVIIFETIKQLMRKKK